ncbi:MAG TPA: hypothetical protein VF753_10555 [Terriglobales bacterium]
MQIRQLEAGTVLATAVLSSAVMAVLRYISMVGVTKTFGRFTGWTFLILMSAYFVAALFDLLAIPATMLLSIYLLTTSTDKNQSASMCALLTCLVSACNLLFWLFYCGGIPGTAQRPFP